MNSTRECQPYILFTLGIHIFGSREYDDLFTRHPDEVGLSAREVVDTAPTSLFARGNDFEFDDTFERRSNGPERGALASRELDDLYTRALEQLETLLAQAYLPLAETVPLVAALLALPLPARRYPSRPLPAEQQRQYTLDTLLALVGALAEQQPVLLIVEDLH